MAYEVRDVNLLPWRQLKRERAKKQFIFYLLGGISMALMGNYIAHSYANYLVDAQLSRALQLKNEIMQLNMKMKQINEMKESRRIWLAKILIINNLETIRPLTIHLFDEVAKNIPKNIYLDQMKRFQDKVTLSGYAKSNTTIALFIERILKSKWLKEPRLTAIKKNAMELADKNKFELNFILKS
jgi:type IV pilus assembly protein PilN